MKERRKLVKTKINEIHELKKRLNDLNSRVDSFQTLKKQMGKLLMKIEMKHTDQGKEDSAVSERAISKLNFKMVKIGKLASLLQAEISNMVHKRQSAAQELRSLRLKNRKSDLLLEHALDNIDRLEVYIGALKKEDDENKNEVEALRGKNEQINEWMKKLKRKVDATHAELRNSPIVVKILHNQKVLAETLDNMEGKVTTFDNKQIKSDETYDELRGRVIGDEADRRSLENSLISMKKTLKGLQDDFKRMQNPQSSANMERLRTLTNLKNEVSLLKRSNEEVYKNLKLTRSDLMDLVKDVVNTKLDGQTNRAGVTAVAMAHRHTQQVFDEMSKEQNNVLNKISVIEDVYRRILEVIHNLEVHQVKLKQEVSHFDESIHKMTRSFERLVDDSKNKKLSDQASSLGEALSKLTSESVSDLKLDKLSPVKQLKSTKTESSKPPPAVKKQLKSTKTESSKPPPAVKKQLKSTKTESSKPPPAVKKLPNENLSSKSTSSGETAVPNTSDKEKIAENLKDKLKTLTDMKEQAMRARTPESKKEISVPLKEGLGSVKKSFKHLLLPKNLKFTALKHKTPKEKTKNNTRLHTSEKLLQNHLNKRKDLLSNKVSEIESSLGGKKSPNKKYLQSLEQKLHSQEKKFYAPEIKSPLPEKLSTLPKRLSTLLEKKSTLPEKESTLPEKESTLPEEKSTLPEKESTLPEEESTLPEKESTLPEKESTLPAEKSTLPEKESTLPEKESTLPEKSSPVPEKSSPLAKKKSSLQKKKLNKKRRKGKRRRRRRKNKGRRKKLRRKRKPQG
ncbi:interaptin [Patella vulgata]|uniref:interaptin n=1 Tax=Patella vulgata TaxID=6465 RepID=UPI00218028AB|nr:interaptin [Patella vulgata]